MNQLVTKAIILQRTNYGEADRILTMLTPEYGKLTVLAKGVRKVKSKLAGGIELFSVSEITFIKGRGGIATLVSTRLLKHYEHIIRDIDRTMLGYELIKQFHKTTADEPGIEYFDLMQATFGALDDADVPLSIVHMWFSAQMMRLDGHMPNLDTDRNGQRLDATVRYTFDIEHMAFAPDPQHGRFAASHIKLLRLTFGMYPARVLAQVQGVSGLMERCRPLVQLMKESRAV